MAPLRQVSHRQLQLIVEFAERNSAIALNNSKSGPLGHQAANKVWAELANKLNSIGDGSSKTPDKWRRLFDEAATQSVVADGTIDASCTVTVDMETPYTEEYEVSTIESYSANTQEEQTDNVGRVVPNVLLQASMPQQAAMPLQVPSEIRVEDGARSRNANLGSSNRSNHDDNVPRWAYALEERRIATEDRLVDAVVGLGETNEAMLRCMQQMAATQAQLLQLLRGFMPPQ